MSDESTAAPRPSQDCPGPSFATQASPAPAPAAYGQPSAAPGADLPPPAAATDHVWTPDGLVPVPALPPERVGRGAAFALLAVPLAALVAGVLWKIGFVASITGFVLAAVAAILYLRGSGGRIRKGVAVVAGVIVLGVVASFFTIVVVDLYGYYPRLDPDVAAAYPSRWGFVRDNVFYPPLLKDYTKDGVLLAVFGLIGGIGTIARLVRMRA